MSSSMLTPILTNVKNGMYTRSIICKKDDVEKAKKILVQEIINEDGELDISEIDSVVVPAVFL